MGGRVHHEVRAALWGRAGLEDLGDVRVIHEGQRLALGLEAIDDLGRVHAALDDLQRHRAADGFRLLGPIHLAHATRTDALQNAVAPDALWSVQGLLRGASCIF